MRRQLGADVHPRLLRHRRSAGIKKIGIPMKKRPNQTNQVVADIGLWSLAFNWDLGFGHWDFPPGVWDFDMGHLYF
jgi:hypothetical protein